MSTSLKKSVFTAQTTLADTDFFDFVRTGTNYKVSFADVKASMGVTVDLASVGNPLGSPVMYASTSTSYKFRAIESGKGVIAQISPLNGIQVTANFAQTAGGDANIIADLTADQFAIRPLKGISPIDVNVVGNFIEISQATSPLAQTNTVVVSDMTDFPDAVTGVRTLADNTNYIIVQALSTSDRFVFGANNNITANNLLSPTFTYTGTATMFTGIDVSVTLDNLNITAATGKVFDISSPTTVGGNLFVMRSVVVNSCDSFADFDDLQIVDISNSSAFSANQGYVVAGTTNWSIFSIAKSAVILNTASSIGLDLGVSVHQTFELSDLVVRGPASAIGLKGAASSANLTAGNLATVDKSEFSGGLTPISGITNKDIRWDFDGNSGVPDTLTDALLGFNANATETVIAVVDTPVIVNATWVLEDTSKFITTTGGRATYDGERGIHLPVDISVGVIASGGGANDITVYLYKNGSVVPNTGRSMNVSGANPAALSIPWQLTLVENDYLEIYVENNTGTTNLVVEYATLRIN